MRLAVVVPTRNRPEEVGKLLANLAAQTRAPDTVIVVDGSDQDERARVKSVVEQSQLACSYLRHWPPSAAAQRNAGLSAALPHAELIAFLDDDLTLNDEALEIACDEIAGRGSDFIGFGFNPIDQDAKRGYGVLKSMGLVEALGLYSDRVGAVTPSGWHTRLLHVREPTEVDWLSSCAMIWRAEAISGIRFDEFFVQYSYLEDLEFSLQARKLGRFMILPAATYLHLPAPGGRKSRFWFGRVEVRNRYYIVRKHHLSIWRFWLGTALRSSMTFYQGIARDRGELGRLLGNTSEISQMLVRSILRRT